MIPDQHKSIQTKSEKARMTDLRIGLLLTYNSKSNK